MGPYLQECLLGRNPVWWRNSRNWSRFFTNSGGVKCNGGMAVRGECKRYRKSFCLARTVVLNLAAHNSYLRSFEKIAISGHYHP